MHTLGSSISMKTKVSRTKLLDILKQNLQEHNKILAEAIEGYKTNLVRLLTRELQRARDFGEFVQFHLPKPQSYAKIYESCIKMLEMGEAETIDLDPQEFESLVLDQWDWQQGFLSSNCGYSSLANTKMSR